MNFIDKETKITFARRSNAAYTWATRQTGLEIPVKLAKFVRSVLLLSTLAVIIAGSGSGTGRPDGGPIGPTGFAGGSDTGGPTDGPIDPDFTFAGGSDSGRPNGPIDPDTTIAHGGESIGPNLT